MLHLKKMEALRWFEYLKDDGIMVINDFEIPSVPIQQGTAKYPEGILEDLAAKAKVLVFKAGEIAEKVGNARTMNIVLLGALTKAMDLQGIDWESVIKANVKKGLEDINIKAFHAGADQVK